MTEQTHTSLFLRVFLLDDNPMTQMAIRMVLQQMGHEVICAESLQDAVQKLPQSDCQVLIADRSLPDGNGWDLPKLVNGPVPAPRIGISGRTTPDIVKEAQDGGFQFLAKPFTSAHLTSALAEAMGTMPAGAE